MSEDGLPAIEIRDPGLDGAAIARQVQQQAERRRIDCGDRLDWEALGSGPLEPDGQAAAGAPVGFPGVRESLAELIGRSGLWEPDFQSSTPVVGRLVVAARRLWNWMSTKWYVRPILWQQSDVNARTARLLSDLVQWHELDARRVQELEAHVAELEARLAGVEAEDRR